MKKVDVFIGVVLAVGIITASILAAGPRYPVGQPVASSVYTEPFDPCDPAYRFINPPPKDWAEKFGNSERTMLIHAVSELRVVVAAQGARILSLEADVKKLKQLHFEDFAVVTDPNEGKK